MAVGLKSRVIYKQHTTDGAWTGAYKMLIRAKSIPSPVGERNMVDVGLYHQVNNSLSGLAKVQG